MHNISPFFLIFNIFFSEEDLITKIVYGLYTIFTFRTSKELQLPPYSMPELKMMLELYYHIEQQSIQDDLLRKILFVIGKLEGLPTEKMDQIINPDCFCFDFLELKYFDHETLPTEKIDRSLSMLSCTRSLQDERTKPWEAKVNKWWKAVTTAAEQKELLYRTNLGEGCAILWYGTPFNCRLLFLGNASTARCRTPGFHDKLEKVRAPNYTTFAERHVSWPTPSPNPAIPLHAPCSIGTGTTFFASWEVASDPSMMHRESAWPSNPY